MHALGVWEFNCWHCSLLESFTCSIRHFKLLKLKDILKGSIFFLQNMLGENHFGSWKKNIIGFSHLWQNWEDWPEENYGDK